MRLLLVIKDLVLNLFLPTCIVFLTSLPFYIILRLYPTILNFNNDSGTSFISKFYIIAFIGASLAFQLSDFGFGQYVTILLILVIKLVCLILAMLSKTTSPERAYISLLVLGFPFGVLQTCITVYFGDRFSKNLAYDSLAHWHVYLITHAVAYSIPIHMFHLTYPMTNYGICYASICQGNKPLQIAIVLVFINIILYGVLYCPTFRTSLSTPRLMKYTTLRQTFLGIMIFCPFVFFWLLTFQTEHFWIIQGENMNKLGYVTIHVEQFRAYNMILCAVIAVFIRLWGDVFLRIILGGLLIALAVIYSSSFGNFNIEPHINMTKPNMTVLHGCASFQLAQYNSYHIEKLTMIVPNHQCAGPYFIQTDVLRKNSFARVPELTNNNVSDRTYHFELPNNSGYLVFWLLLQDNRDEDLQRIMVDRDYRSLSSLPLIRVFGMRFTVYKAKLDANGKRLYRFTLLELKFENPAVQINISIDDYTIYEIPVGNCTIVHHYEVYSFNTYDLIDSYYFRAGGYYNIMYDVYKQHFCKDQQLSVFVRIPGYTGNILWQVPQYILFWIGKILILSSGLDIMYALADPKAKSSLVGIFWGIYFLAYIFYYTSEFYTLSTIFQFMIAILILFHTLHYYNAYKMTDIVLSLDDSVPEPFDNEDENEQPKALNKAEEPKKSTKKSTKKGAKGKEQTSEEKHDGTKPPDDAEIA